MSCDHHGVSVACLPWVEYIYAGHVGDVSV